MANGTIFVEFKEEVLPKCIPAVIDALWYPPVDGEEDGKEEDGVVEEPGE
jgi:hypothetical protein